MMRNTIIAIALTATAVSARSHRNDDLLQSEVPPEAFERARLANKEKRQSNRRGQNNPAAQEQNLSDEERFLEWATRNNRHYSNNQDIERHRRNWQETDDYINRVNREAQESEDPDALTLAHNQFSDMDAEERARHFGRASGNSNLRGGRNLNDEDVASFMNDKRFLQAQDQSINWVQAGKVTPVKDQGDCGSCYAFSGNTALESAIAIAENSAPVHLSEQEIVDCSSNYGNMGCNGGLENNNWEYQMGGAVSNSEYPYFSGTSSNGGACQANGKTDIARVTDYGDITGGAAEILTRLQDGPVTVGIKGENQGFYNYAGGILRADNCSGDNIDHGVVIVGYEAGGEGTTETVTTTETWCRYQSWWDRRYYTGCRYWDEFLVQDRYCCWEETTTEVIQSSGDAYWLVQNSWGTQWGESGFVRMAVDFDGWGACGINRYPAWVQGQSI